DGVDVAGRIRVQLDDLRVEHAQLIGVEQGVVDEHVRAAAVQLLDHRYRARESHLLHVLAIGGAEDQDPLSFQPAQRLRQGGDRDAGHAVVDLPTLSYQPKLTVGRIAQQEMRIDGDAVAANADAGSV